MKSIHPLGADSANVARPPITVESAYWFIRGWRRGGGTPPLVLTVGEWVDLSHLSTGGAWPQWPTPDTRLLGIPIRLECPHDGIDAS